MDISIRPRDMRCLISTCKLPANSPYNLPSHEDLAAPAKFEAELFASKPTSKARQHFVYLSVHVSRPCWIDGSPLISMIGLSHVENTFCLYAAPLLVKPRPIE